MERGGGGEGLWRRVEDALRESTWVVVRNFIRGCGMGGRVMRARVLFYLLRSYWFSRCAVVSPSMWDHVAWYLILPPPPQQPKPPHQPTSKPPRPLPPIITTTTLHHRSSSSAYHQHIPPSPSSTRQQAAATTPVPPDHSIAITPKVRWGFTGQPPKAARKGAFGLTAAAGAFGFATQKGAFGLAVNTQRVRLV
ncbi:hypothetical protein Tco_0502459 [Tanacetum coccineum]